MSDNDEIELALSRTEMHVGDGSGKTRFVKLDHSRPLMTPDQKLRYDVVVALGVLCGDAFAIRARDYGWHR